MARLFYSLMFYCLVPVILLKLWLRGKKAPLYRQRWLERFGFVIPVKGPRPVWMHAVSLGETIAITPLVEKLLSQQPEVPVIITSMTPTGSARVKAQFGERVLHCYCPYDLPDALGRFLRRINPRCCVIVETELWPNLIHSCHKRTIPVQVTNARLSERSAVGYRRVRWLSAPMLQQIDAIAVQNGVDGERFVKLGFNRDRLSVTGSIKFDISAPQGLAESAQALRQGWGVDRPVLIAASTHDDEEQQLLEVYRNLQSRYQELLLILVPRHPERFSEIYELCVRSGLNTCRRSLGQQPGTDCKVYLGDTMGEMMLLYAASDIAFVGGSLIERGGHNPLEPALLAKPVLMGPHIFNFSQVVTTLEQALALQVVADTGELQQQLVELLAHPDQARAMGIRGANCIAENRGALQQQYDLMLQLSGITP